MAQKVVMISEEEIEDLKRDIITEIHKFSKKGYGFKIVSRETGKEITDDMMVLGMLLRPIEQAFGALWRKK